MLDRFQILFITVQYVARCQTQNPDSWIIGTSIRVLKINLNVFPVSEHEDQRASWVVGPGELTATPQDKDGVPLPPSKPRIWSMAELAVSKSSYVGCG